MDLRRKRLAYQAQYRGMKEMDIILGRFSATHLAELDDTLVDQFEALLVVPDQKLYGWILGREEVPADFNNEIMAMLKSFQVVPDNPSC